MNKGVTTFIIGAAGALSITGSAKSYAEDYKEEAIRTCTAVMPKQLWYAYSAADGIERAKNKGRGDVCQNAQLLVELVTTPPEGCPAKEGLEIMNALNFKKAAGESARTAIAQCLGKDALKQFEKATEIDAGTLEKVWTKYYGQKPEVQKEIQQHEEVEPVDPVDQEETHQEEWEIHEGETNEPQPREKEKKPNTPQSITERCRAAILETTTKYWKNNCGKRRPRAPQVPSICRKADFTQIPEEFAELKVTQSGKTEILRTARCAK